MHMNAMGSCVPCPNIMLASTPETAAHRATPMVAPIRTGRMACQSTGRMTLGTVSAQSHTNADVTYGSASAIRHHSKHANRAEHEGNAPYPTGTKVSKNDLAQLAIQQKPVLPRWNYTISPRMGNSFWVFAQCRSSSNFQLGRQTNRKAPLDGEPIRPILPQYGIIQRPRRCGQVLTANSLPDALFGSGNFRRPAIRSGKPATNESEQRAE